MKTRAITKYVRMSGIKMIPVAKLVRGKNLKDAENILKFKTGKAAEFIEATLNSAKFNAINNKNMLEDNLYIFQIRILQGPTLKRYRAGARGSAARILKRTAHIEIILEEIVEGKRHQAKKSADKKEKEEKKLKREEKKVIKDEKIEEEIKEEKKEKANTEDKKIKKEKAESKKVKDDAVKIEEEEKGQK